MGAGAVDDAIGDGKTMLVIVEDSARGVTDDPGRNCTSENTKKEEKQKTKDMTMAPHEPAATQTGVVSNNNR